MDLTWHSALSILEVVWINLLLSGDNAVVIAMACRGLPANRRRMGLVLGAGVAVVLRIVFTVIVARLLQIPFLRIGGSALLVWVAVRLLVDEDDAGGSVKANDRLLAAVWTIAVADTVMSLDNVLAIVAVAKGDTMMLVLGLVLSIPLIVGGATLIMSLLARFPLLVWAGAALLGWVAGDMVSGDPVLVSRFGEAALETWSLAFAATGLLFVLACGWILRRRRQSG